MNERVRTSIKVIEKCSKPRRQGETKLRLDDLVIGQTLFLAPHLLMS